MAGENFSKFMRKLNRLKENKKMCYYCVKSHKVAHEFPMLFLYNQIPTYKMQI